MSIPGERRDWLDDIERMKGFMIILVVWGHVYDPDLPDWALGIRHAIYTFHMPAFMFLSGYIFVHAKAHIVPANYLDFIAKRAIRLLLPFFSMAAIIIAGKVLSQSVVVVNKPIQDVADSALNLFIHTDRSPVLFIWYLFVLFVISIATPILVKGRPERLAALAAASVLLHIVHVEMFYSRIVLDYLYLNRLIMYLIFFMYGAMAREHADRWLPFVARAWPAALVLFALSLAVSWNSEWRYLLAGCTAVILFHGLMRSAAKEQFAFFCYFGRNAMTIYLFNLIFIGTARGIYTKYFSAHDDALGLLMTAVVLGVFGPIVVKYSVLSIRPLRPLGVILK